MRYFKAKCTKFDFGWGLESLQRSSDPLAGFKGSTSRGGEEREGRRRSQVNVKPGHLRALLLLVTGSVQTTGSEMGRVKTGCGSAVINVEEES